MRLSSWAILVEAVGLLALMVLVGILWQRTELGTSAASPAPSFYVRSIVIQDEQGASRILIHAEREGCGILMADKHENPRYLITLEDRNRAVWTGTQTCFYNEIKIPPPPD